MPANQVTPPFPTFNDQDGYPLNGGYLYIGQPGFEAQSTPKASFFDAGLTIPTGSASGAAVRINNGYAVYNGAPSLVYSDGPCSLTVKDANQVLIFSTLNFDPRIALGLPSQGFPVDVIYQTNFDTRAAFVAAVAGGYAAPTGYTVHAGGLAFVKVASGGISDIPGWASARRLFVGETHIDVADAFNMTDNGPDGMTKMQLALDTAPIGAHLHIPPNFTVAGGTSLVMSRAVQIVTHGALSRIRLDATNPALDALQVAITDAGGFGDVRGLTILSGGGSISTNGTGGNNAININPTNVLAGQKPLFGFVIENITASGRLGGIRVGGANVAGDTNFNVIRDCPFIGATDAGGYDIHLDGCADGHLIEGNILSGQGWSIRLNLVAGAFSTQIVRNVIKGQTGGIVSANADHVDLTANQFELNGDRTGGGYNHILMQGLARKQLYWNVRGNNFGGSVAALGVTATLSILEAEQCVFENNTFGLTVGGVDIALGSGASSNAFRSNKRRGAGGSGLAAPTDLGRRLAVTIDAAALGNEGIWYPAAMATLSNGWTSGAGIASFEFMKQDGMLGFQGNLVPGTLTGGTEMAQLPVGFAARNSTFTAHVNDATSLPSLSVFHTTTGKLQVGVAAASRPMYMSGAMVADSGLPAGYNVGPS